MLSLTRLAKIGYFIALVVAVSLLVSANLSHGQGPFRGHPAVPGSLPPPGPRPPAQSPPNPRPPPGKRSRRGFFARCSKTLR